VRERQIASRENLETTIKMLAGESGVDLISLTPVFDRAAEEGKMIYYPLDAHWDGQGREIAARFIADMLRKRFPVSSSKRSNARAMNIDTYK
jgi:hypothetical protein